MLLLIKTGTGIGDVFMVDTHIHSRYSHDSKQTIDEICKTTVERGIQGVTVTDHVDTRYCEEHNTYENMCNCVRDINRARKVQRYT